MTSNTAIRITELDFAGTKNNLIAWMKNQTVFSDYNFDGAGLNILIDMLVRNTAYMGFYLNMLASESFLDSAVTRDALVSQAKMIGYIPSSRRAGVANVNLLITPPANDTTPALTLPQYTQFQSESINGVNYSFLTIESYSALKNLQSNTFNFPAVSIYEGEHLSYSYPVTDQSLTSLYTIPTANIDTSTLMVTVQNSISDMGMTVFTQNQDITQLDGNSTVFFIQAGENGFYDVYFGDGFLGKPLSNGNIVYVDYVDTDGQSANFANNFTITTAVGGFANVQVTTNAQAAGGADPETNDQIKFRAPLAYTRQNRIVTENDYINVIPDQFPNADQVAVWGGDRNDPPVYGSVFISLKPKQGYVFTNAEKQLIVDQILSDLNVVTVTPVIVDPDYLYVLVNSTVYYDPSVTNKSDADIMAAATAAVQTYNTQQLGAFNSTLAFSELQRIIDNSDQSIRNDDLTITLQKQLQPTLNTSFNYDFSFATEVHRGDIKNKLSTYPTFGYSDGSGNIFDSYVDEVPQSFTGVESTIMIAAGKNYTFANIVITGDGQGAAATAVIVNGKIISINVTSRGSGYSIAEIQVVGDGTGAAAEAVLSQSLGTLEVFYYKADGEKIVTNPSLGTINYVTGDVSLIGFNPVYISANPYYPAGILTFNVEPDSQTIDPVKNRITTIDTTNPLAIQITPETI